jgi:hypothetical protein
MVVRTLGSLPKRMLREKYHPSPLLYKLVAAGTTARNLAEVPTSTTKSRQSLDKEAA